MSFVQEPFAALRPKIELRHCTYLSMCITSIFIIIYIYIYIYFCFNIYIYIRVCAYLYALGVAPPSNSDFKRGSI